jgi:hypothetical protein
MNNTTVVHSPTAHERRLHMHTRARSAMVLDTKSTMSLVAQLLHV